MSHPRPTPGTLDPGAPSDLTDEPGLGSQLAADFRPADELALDALSADALAAQLAARDALWSYVDRIWHRANAEPAGPTPAITALRDLTRELRDHAREVTSEDDED
jgi:DNA-binding GntR family transcriptional regulator